MPSRPPQHTPHLATRRFASRARGVLLAALALTCLTAPVARSQGAFLYALTENGNLSANATVLDKLPAKFSSGNPNSFGEVWWELLVDGPDRYALRLDGRIVKNGVKLRELPYTSVFEGSWLKLAMANGELWTLRNDGMLARDDTVAVALPRGDFFFQGLVARGTDVFTMRSDGAVFKNTDLTPLLQLTGGPGVVSGAADGVDVDTIWRSFVLDPLDNELYAIRNDGKVIRGDPDLMGTTASGIVVAALPFDPFLNTGSQSAVFSELYTDMAFRDDGTWVAVNGAGEVYEEGSHVTPLVDLPGGPTKAADQRYIKVLGSMSFLTLRSDGQIYLGTNNDPLVDLPKKNFRALAISDTPPDLTQFKNSRPIATSMKAVALEGQAISVPVLATDIEVTEADLTFTPNPDTIPEGATWNDVTRTLDWANPGPPGKYTFKVTVDDGSTKPVVSKNTIAVKPMDANELKNRKPIAAKIKKTQALVGIPLNLPILAVDLDGNPLTMSVNLDAHPFTAGATFDTVTGIFSWTPALEHLGKHKVTFFINDGTVTRKRNVKLTVISSLLGI